MPAISPERLADEVKSVQGLISNPKKLRWQVMGILEFYADRTRRSQASLRTVHTDKKFGVPRPVLYALERGLKESISQHPETASAIMEEFWRTEYREMRYLAISFLDNFTFKDLLEVVENWSMELKDSELLTKVAQTFLSSWEKENFYEFSTILTDWLQGQQRQLKNLSLITLTLAVDDPNFTDLPFIYPLLKIEGIMDNSAIRKNLQGLIRALIRRSEAETARFLLDLLERDTSNGRKLVRAVLENFSPDYRLRLKRALSA
jgi:hypothetical protein